MFLHAPGLCLTLGFQFRVRVKTVTLRVRVKTTAGLFSLVSLFLHALFQENEAKISKMKYRAMFKTCKPTRMRNLELF